ncbi:hypothetical protein [Mesorhizobium sp.]|uniref:hypothetical protein n=1 Tax=Mesorhizobium sp. TaxID=1871066 RepID=UPI0025EC04D1|nr:hypothetical protein [Mesorhizobium sp.]
MLDFERVREKEKGLRQKKAKIEADLNRLLAREKEAARRYDTRKKIVLGGMILKAVEVGDVTADYVAALVRSHVAERDKKLLVGTAFAISETASPVVTDSDSRE